jgi:hypothetical protein
MDDHLIGYIEQERAKGVTCPCCGLFVKEYKRWLNTTKVYCLVGLYKAWKGAGTYVHINDVRVFGRGGKEHGGELAKLELWNLAESKPNTSDTSKRTSGLWRPSSLGIRFIKSNLRVPAYVITYNGGILRRSEEMFNIDQAIAKGKFDYAQMMEAV